MDDQRTTLPPLEAKASTLADDDDLFEVLCRIQGARLNDQRAVLGVAPRLMAASVEEPEGENVQEDVFGQVSRCTSAASRCRGPRAVATTRVVMAGENTVPTPLMP